MRNFLIDDLEMLLNLMRRLMALTVGALVLDGDLRTLRLNGVQDAPGRTLDMQLAPAHVRNTIGPQRGVRAGCAGSRFGAVTRKLGS